MNFGIFICSYKSGEEEQSKGKEDSLSFPQEEDVSVC